MAKKHKLKTVIIKDFPGKNVDFFLRLHRHLPDGHCGLSPLGRCNYRGGKRALNWKNKRVVELQKNPRFVEQEKEVKEAVEKWWKENKGE